MIGKERETATRSRAPLFPRFFISLLHLLLLLLLFLLLSSRTPALLCLSSTFRSFVLFRAPLEGLIAAHTRSPFVSSFSPPFLRQPLNLLSLSLFYTRVVSLCGHRPRRADSCLLLAPPFRLLLAFLSNTAGNLSFLLSLSRERSVFIVLLLPLSHPTFRLGAILPLSLSPSKGFKREGERRGRGFNASMTFDHPVPPFSLLLGGFSRWPSRFRDIPPLLLREDCITPPERENNLFDESFDGMIDPRGLQKAIVQGNDGT